MLILEPLAPETTMDLKLLYSERDFWADEPVLSRASFRILLTWFSKVCLSVLPGVGSSSLLWAFSITWSQVGKRGGESQKGPLPPGQSHAHPRLWDCSPSLPSPSYPNTTLPSLASVV